MSTRDILDIVYLVLYACIIIATIVSLMIKIIKSGKSNKKLIAEYEAKEEKLQELEYSQQLQDFVKDSMIKVENFKSFSDIEKQQFVINEAKAFCSHIGIKIEQVDISKIISYFMDVANKINARGTQSKKNIV